jgi:hypothetical protein
MIRGSVIHREAKGEIEIAVVKSAVPTDADLLPAHETLDRFGIEGVTEQLEIALSLILSIKFALEPSECHVGNGQQVCKLDADSVAEFPSVVFFQSPLCGWKKRSSGVVHKIER